jgi:hypothetical protein
VAHRVFVRVAFDPALDDRARVGGDGGALKVVGGRQSSSVKTIVEARASFSAPLRLAPGGAVPGASRAERRVPSSASGWVLSSSSVSGPLES